MSNRILMTAAAALLVAGPAFAGGFAPVAETAAPVAPVVVAPPPAPSGDWTGAYVGGQLGYGRLTLEPELLGLDDTYSGALYGLHAGYMQDFGRFILGGEVDFDGTQITVEDGLDELADIDVGSVVRGKLRAGFDAGRFLPYVTAGVAQARLNSEDGGVADDNYGGNFYGVGASVQLNDRFMVGAEVLRHDFDLEEIGDALGEDSFEGDVNSFTLRGSLRF